MNPATRRPTARLPEHPGRRSARRGYTLLEMVISTGAATVLLGGLMSTIVVANRAWSPDLKPAIKTEASSLTRQLSIDLRSALAFTDRTATAATFTVPDRDSDGQPEVLRYAWSGTSGDPLTVSLNGGTAQVVVADVQTFNMDYLLRSVTAPVIPTSGQNVTVVYLSEKDGGKGGEVDAKSLHSDDEKRIKKIESWGFTVFVLSGNASTADWATQLNKAAAVYVPGSVADDQISKRLYDATVGVVFETASLRDESGFGQKMSSSSATDIDLENTNHFITAALSSGLLKVTSKVQPLIALKRNLGPDVQVLARGLTDSYAVSLAVLEAGARTHRADPVPGRRVILPWGANLTPFDDLTNEALTIMLRSITWAAKLDDSAALRRILYLVKDEYSFSTQDYDRKIMFEAAGFEVRLLNQSTASDVLTKEISESSALYLSSDTDPGVLFRSVNNVSQGIMTDSPVWTVALGFSEDVTPATVLSLKITDPNHPIVSGLGDRSVNIVNRDLLTVVPGDKTANGLTTVLETSSSGKGSARDVVVTIENGERRIDDSNSPGRRTLTPFYTALRADFTADGYTMMQQALAWTASQPEVVVVESSGSSSFSKFLQSLSK
jgi:hypothetical protein